MVSRSSSVMAVMFPNGMVLVSTTRTRMRSAWARMLASSTNETPPGVGPKVGKAGEAEWQVTQRAVTMLRTTAKGTGGPADARSWAFGGEVRTAIAKMASAPGTAAHR